MNFNAYFGHCLVLNEIYQLCNDLNCHKFKSFNDFFKDITLNYADVQNKKWFVDPDSISGTVSLVGPCGLDLIFSDYVCVLSHYIRWSSFIRNDLAINIQSHFRNISYELVDHFNGSYAIYLPDSGSRESGAMDFIWDDEKREIEYIKEWLGTNFGEPQRKIIDLDNLKFNEKDVKGYYIDYFIDLL